MKCRICGNDQGNRAYTAREMMFGLRDSFDYFQCAECGCLQIEQMPSDMSRYYPPSYYSLARVPEARGAGGMRGWARTQRDRFAVARSGVLGRMLSWLSPNEALTGAVVSHFPGDGASLTKLSARSRILDVGCGSGAFLRTLHAAGFRHVQGIDLFLEKDLQYPEGLRIVKGSLECCTGEWDIIMFHHSFEHLPDPLSTLRTAARLLASDGALVLRIPLVSSYAWEKYGVAWVQLDAPRHFYLHSEDSLARAATTAGLRVTRIAYDSTEFQFWGSEQYLRDISLFSSDSYGLHPENSRFSPDDIEQFRALAQELNARQRGDQAAFYLNKS
jgi:SAM-dependent methyltransferase